MSRPTLFWLLLIAAGLPAVSCAQAPVYIADDGKDDRAGLQAEIDRISASGGGTLQLENGTYDLASPLYLRSGVEIAGRGERTILSSKALNDRGSWWGTTLFAGNLTPGSFADETGQGYRGRPVRRVSAQEVALERCSESDVAKLPGKVVWLSSEETIPGRMERPKPVHGEFTVVTGVDGCSIRVADPIEVPPDYELLLHWSDGSRAEPAPGTGEPNHPIRDAGLRNLQLESGFDGQALLSSGCYRCTFTDLHIGNSRRLLMVQGMRHTRYQGITGTFRERGIEVVMYAKDNVVEDVEATFLPSSDHEVRPAIRFGEYARDNVVRNVRLNLGEAYVGRDKIRFDPSVGNRLENITLVVPRDDDRPRFLYKGPNELRAAGDVLPPETSLDGVRLCFAGTENCVPIG